MVFPIFYSSITLLKVVTFVFVYFILLVWTS